ncbi:MAG: hypothetical protein ACFE9C_05810 [Candidatus Hodarchaeota archaeon]
MIRVKIEALQISYSLDTNFFFEYSSLFYNKSTDGIPKPQLTRISQYKSWLLSKLNGIEQLIENL